jgi:hypothetical protein
LLFYTVYPTLQQLVEENSRQLDGISATIYFRLFSTVCRT